MFDLDFEAIEEEERRQKGLKKKRKKEKSPFNEVSDDSNPFGRKRISSIDETEEEDIPCINGIPSYIPQDRLEDDYFKERKVDASNYTVRDSQKDISTESSSAQSQMDPVMKLIIIMGCVLLALGGIIALVVNLFVGNYSFKSSSSTSQTTESPARSKGGSSFKATLDFYELNINDTDIEIEEGDSVVAGSTLHFRVALYIKNPNPDEWDNYISIRVYGAELVEDESYMTNATLYNFNRMQGNWMHTYSDDIDYANKFTIGANTAKTIIIEFSFVVTNELDELTIKIGSDMMSHAYTDSSVMNVSFPII